MNQLELVEHQLSAIDAFHQRLSAEVATSSVSTHTAEQREHAARTGLTVSAEQARGEMAGFLQSRHVLREQHQALLRHSDWQLRASAAGPDLPIRAVIAHRNQWFIGKISDVFARSRIEVVAATDNGAHALGTIIAEQPDLIVVEHELSMLSGVDVVAQARTCSPHSVIIAQVPYEDDVQALADAGAHRVFTRQYPPVDLACESIQLLSA